MLDDDKDFDKGVIRLMIGGVLLINAFVFAVGYDVGKSASKQTPLISVQGNLIIQQDSFNSSQPATVEK